MCVAVHLHAFCLKARICYLQAQPHLILTFMFPLHLSMCFVFDTTLTDYERVRLNAMEERVLPPYVRIKIVFAQANAGDREEEIEASVSAIFDLWQAVGRGGGRGGKGGVVHRG